VTELPDWLVTIRDAALTITGRDLTAFLPPEDSGARPGAVLMLFGEGTHGPDLLLTERAHDMRSHPGQVSFPGGSIDAGETAREAALREAEEETGLVRDGVDVLATLPELWLPPSNFAVTPVLAWWRAESPVSIVDPREVHAVLRVPIDELLDPTHRVMVTHPSGYSSPGFLIGDDKDLILWGFTAGLVNRLFDYVGLTREWDTSVTAELPAYMLGMRQD
jgi:8-oxo-dGTP pyrophosphatase MutT (NUDIX family)